MSSNLSAELGHLARPAATPYDDVRMTLLDTLIAAAADGRLEQGVWDGAFTSAMRSLRMRVMAEIESMLRVAAARSRYPAARLNALLPDAETADTLLHRLLAQGMPLERFEGFGEDPVTRRARAAALDTAWEGALGVVAEETARWRTAAARVAEWHRPTALLWALSAVVLAAALLMAAWLSGSIPSPAWFHPINDLWWRLWP